MKIPWKRIIQAVVLLAALGFLAGLLRSQWRALHAYQWQLSPPWALAALAGLGVAWLLQVGLWRAILGRLGGVLPYWQAVRVWFLSNIVRYIPGNIWQFLGMAELAAEQGVPRVATLTSILLHQVISTAAGLVLAALYFAAAGEGVWIDRLRPFLYGIPVGLLLLQPRLLERGLNWVLARFKRPPLQVTLTWGQVWMLLGGYTAVWLVMGVGFAALVRALTPLTWAQVPVLVAVFAAAYVIGFLSLLTPSGLGVREGVMTLLLAMTLPSGVSAVVAIVARLWMVLGELIGAGISLLPNARQLLPGPRLQVSPSDAPASDIQSGTRRPRNRLGGGRPSTPSLLLLVLILSYTTGFSAMSIRLHQAQLTHKADLGQMDLAIWNTSRGRFVQEVKDDFVSTRLTDHVEPIFAPLSLAFWLWDDVRALLILQSLALAVGALPLFWLARSRAQGSAVHVRSSAPSALSRHHTGFCVQSPAEWLGLLFALVYLMFPALQAANLTEFHAITLAVPLTLFALWAAEREHWVRFAVFCVLLMAVKEEAALLACMLGLYVAFKPLGRRAPWRRRSGGGEPLPPPGRRATEVATTNRLTTQGAIADRLAATTIAATDPLPSSESGPPATGVSAATASSAAKPDHATARASSPSLAQRATHHVPSPTYRSQANAPHASSGSLRGPRFRSLAPLLAGTLVAALSLAWFTVATFVIIPRHAGPVYGNATSVYFQRYGALGSSVGDILRSLLTRPGLVWNTVVEPLRLRYLLGLLAAVGFLPLLAPDILLLGAPLLIANLLSSFAAQYSGAFHYSAPLVPYLVFAGIVGTGRLLGWLRHSAKKPTVGSRARWAWPAAVAIWLLAWSIGWQVAHGYTPIGSQFRWPEVTDHHRLLSRFTSQVPEHLPGSATTALYPHLSHREKLYLFPHLSDAQWTLLDVSGTTDVHPVALRDQVQHMLGSGEWGVLDSADGYLLLERGQGSAQIPDEFYDFARSDSPQPQQAVDIRFGSAQAAKGVGTLRLLGYDVIDDENWRLTRVRTYWQSQGPLPADLRLLPFFVAQDGSIVEDTSERPPVAPLWYPPQRWSTGETVVVETLPWFLPDRWALAVAVSQGQSWGLREQRWRLTSFNTVESFDSDTWALLGRYVRQGGTLRPSEDKEISPPEVPLQVDFGGELGLLGRSDLPEEVVIGGDLRLQLHWQALQPSRLDYSIFLHLRDETGRTVVQWDGQPTWYGEEPTALWTPGESIRSAHTLHLADDVPSGQYRLVVGVYDWRTAYRLPVLDEHQQPVGNELELGALRVEAAGPTAPPRDLCCAVFPECCISLEQQ